MAEVFKVTDYEARTLWLQIVWRHPGLMDGSKVVASVLADHLNMKDGQLNPSEATLADKSGRQPRAVRKAVRDLRLHGLMKTVPGAGRTSSSYTLVVPIEPGTDMPPSVAQTYQAARHILAVRAARKGQEGGTPVPPNLLENLEGNLGSAAAAGLKGRPRRASLETWAPLRTGIDPAEFAGFVSSYLTKQNATLVPGPRALITLDSAFWADYLTKQHKSKFDAAWPAGWDIVGRDRVAT